MQAMFTQQITVMWQEPVILTLILRVFFNTADNNDYAKIHNTCFFTDVKLVCGLMALCVGNYSSQDPAFPIHISLLGLSYLIPKEKEYIMESITLYGYYLPAYNYKDSGGSFDLYLCVQVSEFFDFDSSENRRRKVP